MPKDRTPKRARKKQAAISRRAAQQQAMRAARQKRIAFLTAMSLAIVSAGFAFFAFSASKAKPAAKSTAKPKVSPDPKASATSAPGETPNPQASAAVVDPSKIACDAKLPAAAGSKKEELTMAEDQNLEKSKQYIWNVKTSCGDIEITLDQKRAPKTTNSIVYLSRKGFYDGLTFHRIAPKFVIQGGDPKGDGTGGPGYKTTEAPPKDLKYTKGIVAMAKGGAEPAGTSGSQFFICTADVQLPPDYALVGTVTLGMDVVAKIEGFSAGGDGPPTSKIYIDSTSVAVKG